MHYAKHASRSASLDDSSHEGSDKQPRVKAADLGFHVPDHILPDIIPITDPKLVYTNVHAQRDRRLRLLIRRYTNQIQYGCRNVNCTTPTCLSYRKRNSTGPLRKYTELSARTLACQLVEDYTRHGKEPLAGFCQNEPVVPWYEDPSVTRRRRSSLDLPGQCRHESEHAPKSHVSTQQQHLHHHQRNREPSKHVSATEYPPRRPAYDGVVQAGRRLRSLDINKNDAEIAEGIFDALNSSLARQPSVKERNVETVAGDDNDSQPSSSPQPAQQKDIASFTQTLFDLMPLRLLGWLPARDRSSIPEAPNSAHITEKEEEQKDKGGEEEDQENGETGEQEQRPSRQRTSHTGDTTSIDLQGTPLDIIPDTHTVQDETKKSQNQHHYSLRTLTWSFLQWMRSMDRPESAETYESHLVPFLKQTLVYCLSDPERLVRSVRDLQDDYDRRLSEMSDSNEKGEVNSNTNDDDESPRQEFKQAHDQNTRAMIHTKSKSDVEALCIGFVWLDYFNQRDVLLNSMFTALQHSYQLPKWVQERTAARRSRSASGSNELASISPQGLSRAIDSDEPFATDRSHIPLASERQIFLKDNQVAEVCLIALLSVACLAFDNAGNTLWRKKAAFENLRQVRTRGLAHSRWPKAEWKKDARGYIDSMIQALDVCDDWSVLRLLHAVTDVISHRLALKKVTASLEGSDLPKAERRTIVDLLLDRFDRDVCRGWDYSERGSSWLGTSTIELLRTIMLKTWDGRPVVQRTGPVGGALELLAGMYRERKDLNLDSTVFHMPFIADCFDEMTMPSEWVGFRADPRQVHLLSFSFLFEPATLVRYFRAINVDMMRKSHESASLVYNDTRQYMWAPVIPVYGAKEVLAQLRPHMARFFVLTIRRDNVLDDAINQIWRRQRRELMRPLRVRLGKDEGEDGLDHGGVQQEFFRVAFAEALRADYGMFTIDPTTRMAWFQPGSFEPLYRFECLGILMSIAVYNGITVPVTFPLAFYRKLLGLKVKRLEHIADGWPDLTRGLQQLLDWSDGDVGDVIARTYEFSYDICGSTVTLDMQKAGRDDRWLPSGLRSGSRKGKEKSKSTSFELPVEPSSLTPPSQCSPTLHPTDSNVGSSSSSRRRSSVEIKGISTPVSVDTDVLLEEAEAAEAALVTNDNRERYVKDYVLWLTHKSVQPQYEAFARGFYTCLDRTALSIFTPEALKLVIEGHAEIDVGELERTATYDDYDKTSETVADFWHVVRSFSPEQHRRLLEFVTASDRVPVNGLGSVQFIVQRNGDDDDRLPSSSTCYGRLLLPQYSSRRVLEEKLTKAIENSVGFGTL